MSFRLFRKFLGATATRLALVAPCLAQPDVEKTGATPWAVPYTRTEVRQRIAFDDDWRFIQADPAGAEKPEFSDLDWSKVNVPHDFSIDGEFSPKNSYYNASLAGGVGWYRKKFDLPADRRGGKVLIQFDGVYRDAEVWINGKSLGLQHDGFTSFTYDLSAYVRFDQPNVLAVRVDTVRQPNARWYAGSGIYRHVWLILNDRLHVRNWGTTIAASDISSAHATVQLATIVINDYDEEVVCALSTRILNPGGREVGRASSVVALHPRDRQTIRQEVVVAAPQLWSPDTPSLYVARTDLVRGGYTVDDYASSFGIRSLVFDKDRGFLLNGQPTKFKGACLHQDGGSVGVAVPERVWVRRLEMLKRIGCNAIRTSHNPVAPELMNLFDRMGFLVMEEFADKWKAPFNYEFENEWPKLFDNTLARDRNHPCVVLWSVGNESGEVGSEYLAEHLSALVRYVHQQDATRPVVSGLLRGKDKDPDEKVGEVLRTARLLDVFCLNYGEQWYEGIRAKDATRPILSSESYVYLGSTPAVRNPRLERNPWFDVMKHDWAMGSFLWAGIDYLGEFGWPAVASEIGLLDYNGTRKPVSYLWESFWSGKPTVHLAVYEQDPDDVSKLSLWGFPKVVESWTYPEKRGKPVNLVTYTNCESVELMLNGRSLGEKKLADAPNWIMKWREIAYEPGTISAVGKNGGRAVCTFELKTAGAAQRVLLAPDRTELAADGQDVSQVEVSLADANGVLVPNGDQTLNFKLTGPARIIGVGNGDPRRHVSFRDKTSCDTFRGRCLVTIQSTRAIGPIKLVVEGKGIAAGMISLEQRGNPL